MESKDYGTIKFELPFEPYPNQLLFMRDAYKCVDTSSFGLFESPTGSGKTISILCSVLTWLKENRISNLMDRLNLNGSNDPSVPEWLRMNARNQNRSMLEEALRLEEEELDRRRDSISHNFEVSDGVVRLRFKHKLDSRDASNLECVSDEGIADRMQILICSRTFSQLNQYVKELRRLGSLSRNIRVGIAASRFQLCINEKVRNRCAVPEEFNDDCRRSKCDYRKDVDDLVDSSRCFPLDMEELMEIGKVYCSCPYYSNLKLVPKADIILAPYITIINESLRNNLGIHLDGNIVIIDEGHNLNDAITESQSCKITKDSLRSLLKSCTSFSRKFTDTFSTHDVNTVIQLIKLLLNNEHCHAGASTNSEPLTPTESSTSGGSSMDRIRTLSVSSFIVDYGMEDVKFHEVLNFLTSTEFCRYLKAWSEREYHAQKKNDPNLISNTSAIYTLRDFVSIILSSTIQDFVIISNDSFELYCVSTDEIFHNLAKRAKSVIIMSGTLSPIEEFKCLVPKDMNLIIHASPPIFAYDRFLTKIIDTDRDGNTIRFDYQNRGGDRELSYLCFLLESLSQIVPNGMVCFFSSYAYLGEFMKFFNKSSSKVKIMTKKKIYFEGVNLSFDVYSKSALEGTGAILFAVFGGTQSEGVNFTDGLARLVLLVGLPYPPDSLKLRLKRTYYSSRLRSLDMNDEYRNVLETLESRQRSLLCYKMVNQCIGRAMRHKLDYAAVILVDCRYRNKESEEYLSSYILKSIRIYDDKAQMSGSSNVNVSKQLQEFYHNLNT